MFFFLWVWTSHCQLYNCKSQPNYISPEFQTSVENDVERKEERSLKESDSSNQSII